MGFCVCDFNKEYGRILMADNNDLSCMFTPQKELQHRLLFFL